MRALCWHGKGDVRVDTLESRQGRRGDDPGELLLFEHTFDYASIGRCWQANFPFVDNRFQR